MKLETGKVVKNFANVLNNFPIYGFQLEQNTSHISAFKTYKSISKKRMIKWLQCLEELDARAVSWKIPVTAIESNRTY